jgi:ankyrin repeat protein
MTALMYAARQGQINGVTSLADAGANLNVVDPEGSTAMVIAIINAHYEVAARLAEKGRRSEHRRCGGNGGALRGPWT